VYQVMVNIQDSGGVTFYVESWLVFTIVLIRAVRDNSLHVGITG
jgi:hypothetical protein